MVRENATQVVRGQEEAWNLFSGLVLGDHKLDASAAVPHFVDCSSLTIKVPRGRAIITPSMMRGFVGLQDSIYRSHTLLNYNSGDLRKLSDEDRSRLEFEVKVTEGSSQYDADIWQIVEKLGFMAVGKMEPLHLTITLLGMGTLLAGTIGWKWYLKHKADIRLAELDTSKNASFLAALTQNSKEETERLKIFEKAFTKVPELERIRNYTDEGKDAIISSMRHYPTSSLNGIQLPGQAAEEIIKSNRRDFDERMISGTYRVLRVDTTSSEGFRVKLKDINTEMEITARLRDSLAREQQGKDLQTAEWSRKNIACEIKARMNGNEVYDAVIHSTKISDDE